MNQKGIVHFLPIVVIAVLLSGILFGLNGLKQNQDIRSRASVAPVRIVPSDQLESYGDLAAGNDRNKNGLMGDTSTGRFNNYKVAAITGEDYLIENQISAGNPLYFSRCLAGDPDVTGRCDDGNIPFSLDGYLSTIIDGMNINAYFGYGGSYQYATNTGNIRKLTPTSNTFVIEPFYDYAGNEVGKKLCRDYAGIYGAYKNDDGTVDFIVHCEYHPEEPKWEKAYWSIALYRLVWDANQGKTVYKHIAPIITSFDDYDPNFTNVASATVDGITIQGNGAGMPSVIRKQEPDGLYYYVYYNDYNYDARPDAKPGESAGHVTVARAKVTEAGIPAKWQKFYRGTFSQPANAENPFATDGSGKAGKSNGVFYGQFQREAGTIMEIAQASVSYNTYTKTFMAVGAGIKNTWNGSDFSASNKGIYMSFSNDGIYWSEPSLVQASNGELHYPAAINDTNGNSHETGKSFKLVYVKAGKAYYRTVTISRMFEAEVQCNKIDDNGNGTIDEAGCETFVPPAPTPTPVPPCTGATITPNLASPQDKGQIINFTAQTTGCNAPQYRFWTKSPTGNWTMAQDYSTKNTLSWDTMSLSPDLYLISVWVRQNDSTKEYETNQEIAYTIKQAAACSSATLVPSPLSPQMRGIPSVSMTASVKGCSVPEYQFWTKSPTGEWTIMQAYNNTNTFKWDTSNLPAATYQISVWIKQRGATTPTGYETANNLQYTITTPSPCSGVSFTTSPTGTQDIGSPVLVSAQATGCTNAVYQLWVKANTTQTWSAIGNFQPNKTMSWNTTGLRSGKYDISVWAKEATSPNAYETSTQQKYTLMTPVACTSSALQATATNGNVTLQAFATPCLTPEYRYWILPPGGAWTMLQDYSTTNTFTWNGSGKPAGTYQFSVWVRQKGNNPSAGYETSSIQSVTR